ncbi:MAG: alpha/beta hydrolase [Sphingopyxis sp.]|nr:alpha/beta hydrolase [Sphingopyxis sp.]
MTPVVRPMLILLTLAALIVPALALARPTAPVDPAIAHANSVRSGPIAYRDGWYGTGDTRLHYVEAGRGPLVILYHGFPSFWYSWFDQMEVLKHRYRVVAVDGLGANLSGKPDDLAPYRVAALAKQLDGLARHLNGKRRFTLVGHDWGAALAFAYAQAYPDRLRGVAGISAPPFNQFLDLVHGDAEQQARSGYMQWFRSLTLADIKAQRTATQIFEASYRSLIASGALTAAESDLFRTVLSDPATMNGGMNWYRANVPPFAEIGDDDFWPAREVKLAVPSLLIWGNADKTFVPSFIDRFQAAAPQAQVVRIDGVNHWATMETDPTTTKALAAFVDRVAR